MAIENRVYIPYMGGRIILTPAGEFTNDKNELVKYEDSIRVEGLGPYPVKLPAGFIKALMSLYKSDARLREFVDTLAKKEEGN